jgi:hypothetical protein
MSLHMSERDDRSMWQPRRINADFVDTTDLAPFEAAHAASEVEDTPRNANVVPRGSSLLKLAVLLVVGCLAAALVLQALSS